MGDIRKYSCECGYEEEVYVGAGFSGVNLTVIERIFPEAIKDFIPDREKGIIKCYLLDNAVFECLSCKRIFTGARFSYEFTDGKKVVHYKKDCEICGHEGKLIFDENHIQCPKCGKVMKYQEVGLWD